MQKYRLFLCLPISPRLLLRSQVVVGISAFTLLPPRRDGDSVASFILALRAPFLDLHDLYLAGPRSPLDVSVSASRVDPRRNSPERRSRVASRPESCAEGRVGESARRGASVFGDCLGRNHGLWEGEVEDETLVECVPFEQHHCLVCELRGEGVGGG